MAFKPGSELTPHKAARDQGTREEDPAAPHKPSDSPALPQLAAAMPAGSLLEHLGDSVPSGKIPKDSASASERGLWRRLLSRLELARAEPDRVTNFVRFYSGRPAYLDRVFSRARPFLPYIVNRLEAADLPLDLALLPVVESAFRPFAYSSGQAAGVWQFTPATGRRYDLKQNWWYDGRRDVLAETEAAIDYLSYLHEEFDSWLLALAAYNSGAGTVIQAIRQNRDAGQPTDFWHLDLPQETSSYVPQLLALSYVLQHRKRYGLELPSIPRVKGFEVVRLDGPIDLAQAAGLADLEIKALYTLNPGLNRWATPPDGPHRLLVPRGTKERLKERLAELEPSERVRWVHHRIEPGDTLSELARRYRTTVEFIKRVNHLKNNRLIAGHSLMVPTATAGRETYILARSQHLRARRAGEETERVKLTYEAQSGDTLSEIAQSFGVETRKLAQWNNIALQETLHVGQELTVWVAGYLGARDRGHKSLTRLRYQVQRGDSLWAIARRFNVPVHRLRSWNGLDETLIHPGDQLTLYKDLSPLLEHQS